MKLWHHIPERVKLVTPQLGKLQYLQVTVFMAYASYSAFAWIIRGSLHMVIQDLEGRMHQR
jgi:hypothetical protein